MGSMVQHFVISDSMETMGSMVQHSLMISGSMEKHGEHETAFSHHIRQHGNKTNDLILNLTPEKKSMGSMVQHFLMIQTAWECMGSIVTPLFHDLK